MTTLQEAAMRKALELGKKYAKCLMMNQAPFDEALAALAQQGEQQQVVKEVVVHADYRAMWQEVTRQNQQLCAALSAAPEPQAAPVAWVWNPASIEWEKVRAFGHWQQGALYAFGPTQPEPLAAPAPQAQGETK